MISLRWVCDIPWATDREKRAGGDITNTMKVLGGGRLTVHAFTLPAGLAESLSVVCEDSMSLTDVFATISCYREVSQADGCPDSGVTVNKSLAKRHWTWTRWRALQHTPSRAFLQGLSLSFWGNSPWKGQAQYRTSRWGLFALICSALGELYTNSFKNMVEEK